MKTIIEMPKGSKAKYEIKDGQLTLDRMLYYPVPENYGYMPETLAEDGDALDVFVVSDETILPTALVNIEILAMFECLDNGVRDTKLIAKVKGTNTRLADKEKIEHYLNGYKRGFQVLSYTEDNEKILNEINSAKKRYEFEEKHAT
jgi:inorganic pyrophosphatase